MPQIIQISTKNVFYAFGGGGHNQQYSGLILYLFSD